MEQQDIYYKNMVAVYDKESDIWGIFPVGAEQTVANLIATVHGPDRNEAKAKMESIYRAKYPARKV